MVQGATESETPTTGRAFFALGFRPFYLAAGAFAASALPMWLAVFSGLIRPDGYLTGAVWHSHEMLFGFTSAVIAGFLLTAVRNWTSRPTPTGPSLAAMLILWVCGRVLAISGPANLAAIVDLSFLPVLAVAIGVPIWRSRDRRNIKVVAVLLGLTIANALFHLAHLELIEPQWSRVAMLIALDLLTILMAIIGGRVIPAFTANAIPTANPRRVGSIEAIALGALVAILLLDLLGGGWYAVAPSVTGILLVVAAASHAVRWALWKPQATLGNTLLWMLPVAYAWIPVSLAMRAGSALFGMPSSAAVHGLTLGAISALMVAMMTRSALGHTGRPLKAGIGEIAAFGLVQLAAIVRLLGAFVEPGQYRTTVMASGVLWSLGFAVFVVRYWPILTRARVDGRPG